MTQAQKGGLQALVVLAMAIAVAIAIAVRSWANSTVSVTGAVVIASSDPQRQMPIAGVDITASDGVSMIASKSDSSGFFHLSLHPGVRRRDIVTLTFRHPGYQPLEMTELVGKQLCVARMTPISTETQATSNVPEVVIGNVRLRYSVKSATTVSIGSAVKTFEVVNKGNVPCDNRLPCSPDGKWKAAIASTTLDAGERNVFQEPRASCIAGPCPFTTKSITSSNDGRTVTVTALNWSDTTTFLVEAEVVRTMVGDLVREFYPVKFGRGMSFTLPADAEGLTLEAEVDGSDIVFPLGPEVILSWADCDVKTDPRGSKLYSCELKPGYRFQ